MRALLAGLFLLASGLVLSSLAFPAWAVPVAADFDAKVDSISSLMGHDQAISEVLADESEVRKLAGYTPAEQACLRESYRKVAKVMIHDFVKHWIATPEQADAVIAFGQTLAGNKFFGSMKQLQQPASHVSQPGAGSSGQALIADSMTAEESAQVQAFLVSPAGKLLMTPPAPPNEQEEAEYEKRVFGDCKLPVPDAVASP